MGHGPYVCGVVLLALAGVAPRHPQQVCASAAVAGAGLGLKQRGLQLADHWRRGARDPAVLSDARLGRAAGLAHPGRRPPLRLRLAFFTGVVLVLLPRAHRACCRLADAHGVAGRVHVCTHQRRCAACTVRGPRACLRCLAAACSWRWRWPPSALAQWAWWALPCRQRHLDRYRPAAGRIADTGQLGVAGLRCAAAGTTALVLMLSEVMFASVSSTVLLGAATLKRAPCWAGR